MKLFLNILGLCLLLVGCQEQKKSTKTSEERISIGDNWQLEIQQVEAAEFHTALSKDQQQLLTDRLCKESKGYNKNEWPGMNACEWATEKYHLSNDKNQVERNGDLLILKLKDGKTKVLKHDIQNEDKGIYYFYNGYLPEIHSFLVIVKPAGQCLQSLIINAEDGTEQKLTGIPYFSKNKQTSIVTSYQSASSKCNTNIEFWHSQGGKMVKTGSFNPQKWGIDNLTWNGENQFYIKKHSQAQSAPQYALVSLISEN